MVQRPMDHFIKTDIDPKHSGEITKADTKKWPAPIVLDDEEFVWPWKTDQDRLTYKEIEKYLRDSTKIDATLEKVKASPLYGTVCDRPDFYSETARIKAPVYIYTGKLDLQTPESEAFALKAACDKAAKSDCYLHLIPDVGHGFSPPRGPRRHPLADLTVGPVNDKTLSDLDNLAHALRKK